MVETRKLAVPYTTIFICQLPKATQEIIEKDCISYASEKGINLEWDHEAHRLKALTGRFCDIEEIYNFTQLEFCEPGEDIIAYKESISRTITLELPDEDFRRLCKKAGEAGLKISALLENFVQDLVGGTRTNGSDERMHANDWFDRCWFGMEFNHSFLQHLVEWGGLENAIDIWDTLELYKDEENPDEEILEEIREMEEELKDMFDEYKSWHKDATDSFEEEMANVVEWYRDVKSIEERSKNAEMCKMV